MSEKKDEGLVELVSLNVDGVEYPILKLHGLDDCIIGLSHILCPDVVLRSIVVYDSSLLIVAISNQLNMTLESAAKFLARMNATKLHEVYPNPIFLWARKTESDSEPVITETDNKLAEELSLLDNEESE